MKKLLVTALLPILICPSAFAQDYKRISFACRNGRTQSLIVGGYEGFIVKQNGARHWYEVGEQKIIRITKDSIFFTRSGISSTYESDGAVKEITDTTAAAISDIKTITVAKPDPELTGTVVGDILLCLIFPPALPYQLTRQAWVNTFPVKRYRVPRKAEWSHE